MKSKFIKFATSSFMSFLIDYALFCGLSFIFSKYKNLYINSKYNSAYCECSVQLYDKLPSGFQRKADN